MDLNQLDLTKGAAEGHKLTLKHPTTGDLFDQPGKELWIEVIGADSQDYRDALMDIQRRRMARIKKTRDLTTTPEQIDAEALELLCVATRRWQLTLDGVALPCDDPTKTAVYRRFAWIREQVDAAIEDRANFLRPSAERSSLPPSTSSV